MFWNACTHVCRNKSNVQMHKVETRAKYNDYKSNSIVLFVANII